MQYLRSKLSNTCVNESSQLKRVHSIFWENEIKDCFMVNNSPTWPTSHSVDSLSYFYLFSRDHYVTSAGWIKNRDVGIIWTSRPYNLSIISVCPKTNGICDEVRTCAFIQEMCTIVLSHLFCTSHYITSHFFPFSSLVSH